MSDNHPYLNFDEYIRQGEPSQKEKALNWETAIGLQAVDGLRVSDYLRETAQKHIEGEISSDDVKRRIKEYYQTKTKREPDDDERQEADSVSSNIQEILATNTLDCLSGKILPQPASWRAMEFAKPLSAYPSFRRVERAT